MLILMKTKSFIKSLLTGLFLLSALSMTAQQHTVTGTVVDADNGEPLIGVGVIVSTGGGTTTDANGYLTLKWLVQTPAISTTMRNNNSDASITISMADATPEIAKLRERPGRLGLGVPMIPRILPLEIQSTKRSLPLMPAFMALRTLSLSLLAVRRVLVSFMLGTNVRLFMTSQISTRPR